MITAVDSSIILDIIVDDTNFADVSESALRKAHNEGKLIICECVAAEIFPAFHSNNIYTEFLNDWQLDFIPSSLESAELAGGYYKVYLKRGGNVKRVVPDFLIGAHAMLNADRLLTRDRGYMRDYFSNLYIWDPTKPE
ncbi:MAG: type II toxin-antitoxin system VapC family toxin [Spirochaetales bacterium]|nr:type II toxin-antitoxin system VapC family toxin [Spirochaetales bacterium]